MFYIKIFFECTEKFGNFQGTFLHVQKIWLVTMSLCKRPAGQSMEKTYALLPCG